MANLKVFISSTCFDMHAIRAQLRSTLLGMGYEPVMSDQADVIYDPRSHTHTSCLREVENCDVLVVVIGSRFGGVTVPKALELIDLARVADWSKAEHFAEDKTNISITQAEVLRAIGMGVPIFAFVDSGVMRDHLTYEKNKKKSIIGEIDFSSIDKRETAPYIFEFINFLRFRNENNSIFEFSRFEDIEGQLKKQWSGLFQRLLHEQRGKAIEVRRIDNLSGQIADLKAAVLGSISNTELKETAKGAIRFRMMIEFLTALVVAQPGMDILTLIHSQDTWEEVLKKCRIVDIRPENKNRSFSPSTVLLRDDATYYRARISMIGMTRLQREWEDFRRIGKEAKEAISSAVLDSRQGRPSFLVRHFEEPFMEDINTRGDEDLELEVTSSTSSTVSRILLTEAKYVEEAIKNHLAVSPNLGDKRFLIDVKDRFVTVAVLPGQLSGSSKTFTYAYTPTDSGGLGEAVASLTSAIDKDLTTVALGE